MASTGDPHVAAFGAAVIRRLADLGHSRTWLGEQLGVSRQSVNEWINTRVPKPKRVYEIEDVLGVPGQLAKLAGYERPGHADELPTLATVLAADPLLDEEGRAAILALYRALTGP